MTLRIENGLSTGSTAYANVAGIASLATYATVAGTSTLATYATTAGTSTSSAYATVAGTSTSSTTSNYATVAGTATSATTASYATIAGTATSSTTANYATIAGTSTSSSYATVAGTATSVTTNANLTGPVRSVGNATSVSFSGTGTNFVMDTSPTLITPVIGSTNDILKTTSGVVSVIGSPVKNYIPIYNGTSPVWAAQGTTFTFSVATFTDTGASTTLIGGAGAWKAIGALSFTATYNNGPATSANVSMSGAANAWSANLILTGATSGGPNVTTEVVNYPSTVGSITYTVHATDGNDIATKTVSNSFTNYRRWGITNSTSGWISGDIASLTSSDTTNSGTASGISVNVGVSQYFLWSSRTVLGTRNFKDHTTGFGVDMLTSTTVSYTNDGANGGFTEDYYAYRSTNSNIGALVIDVT